MSKKNLQINDMGIHPVDPNSPVPLYHQIESDLRRLIDSGVLSPRDVLPPELELARAYGVGRHTMREALGRLAADDLITRRAGMGTVVNETPNRSEFFLDRSFTHQMAAMGRRAHSQVLDSSTGLINTSLPMALQRKYGAPYFWMQRLRLGDEQPIGIQSSYVVTERCQGIDQFNFNTNSLYAVLAESFSVAITKITHTVSAIVADELQAELLQIGIGAPLLLVRTNAYLSDVEIIEHSDTAYRADLYEFSMTAHL